MKAALAPVLLLVTGACEREYRDFEPPEVQRRPAFAPPSLTLHAGATPVPTPPLDETMPGYIETAYQVSVGKQLYARFNCVGCHANGGGAMGPPFLDADWTYGSRPLDVAISIVSGRPEGMPSYRGKIQTDQLYALVAYVRSLGGLVRGDAVPARDDHLKSKPSQTLQHWGVPLPSREAP